MAVRLLAITSCTGEKAVRRFDQLHLEDFRDAKRLRQREQALEPFLRSAGEMYIGRQQVHLMAGVQALRARFGNGAVDVRILSAGYGLIPEDRRIAPYQATFNDMGKREARDWARRLGIPQAVRDAIKGYPLVVFLLGSRYLDAVEPPVIAQGGQRLLFFAKPDETERVAGPGVTVVPAGKVQATTYGEGLVALKGQMFELLGLALVEQGQRLFDALCRDSTAKTAEQALLAVRQRRVPAR